MNRTVLAGLFLDAYQQVIDNKVFRILVALTLVLVGATFVVAIRNEGIHLLWFPFTWTDLGLPMPRMPDRGREEAIGLLQELVVTNLIGLFGPLVCVAATAFFVPRMLERGAADTLFSKPVGRMALLATRYVAGLLFVTLLAVLLVGGMQLGFWLRSGFADPGFLWSAPMLVYRYALLFGFTVLVGAWTRSSTAALLLTFLFAGFNGCVHIAADTRAKVSAVTEERTSAQEARRAERERERAAAGRPVRHIDRNGAERDSGPGPVQRALFTTLEVAQFVLPKPGDAPRLVQLLRRDGESDDPDSDPDPGPSARPFEDEPLTWGGPARTNAFVSIGTSLGFLAACLLLAGWRVRRMRF